MFMCLICTVFWKPLLATKSCIAYRAQRTIFTRDETGLVYLPTQLERTLQLYWWWYNYRTHTKKNMLLSGNKLLRLMYYVSFGLQYIIFWFLSFGEGWFLFISVYTFFLFWKCLIEFSSFICFVFWKSSLHGDQRTSFCLCLLDVSSVVHFCSQMSLLAGLFNFLFCVFVFVFRCWSV